MVLRGAFLAAVLRSVDDFQKSLELSKTSEIRASRFVASFVSLKRSRIGLGASIGA
jgi:hypothetical protein